MMMLNWYNSDTFRVCMDIWVGSIVWPFLTQSKVCWDGRDSGGGRDLEELGEEWDPQEGLGRMGRACL